MFFRIDVEEVIHKRYVFDFTDFLGSVGGIVEILTRSASFVLGGYLAWNSAIETMVSLYSCEHSCSNVGTKRDHHHKGNILLKNEQSENKDKFEGGEV